jgi:nucleoid-associated protein YgaU
MLNKDQYNEDAYNDVYAQAAKGAEIKYSTKKKGKSKLLLIFLLLALISTLGYFVWKNLSSTKEVTTTKSLVDKNKEISLKKETTPMNETEESLEVALQKTLETAEEEKSPTPTSTSTTGSTTADIVANIASQTSDTKMSPTDIARIVQLVTQQMQAEKKVEESKVQSNKKVKDSLELSLENVETDTLSSEKLVLEPTNSSQKKEASNDTKTNTYNKIVLEKSNGKENLNDELSKLSMEISNVINSDSEDVSSSSESTSYTSSLSKEADTRTKEMRYHIVKKGDTLASIAYKIYGQSKDYIKLYEANPDILRRADQIYIGQRLRVPE